METRSSNLRAPPATGPNICRVCLVNGGAMATVAGESKTTSMESIFTPVGEYEDKSLYGILVTVCAPLGQRETLPGGVPERICRSCKWRLLAAYELHQTCLRSDDKLREKLDAVRREQQLVIKDVAGGVRIKQEVLDPDEQDVNQNSTADAVDFSAMFSDSYLPEAESTLLENLAETFGQMDEPVDPYETLFEEHYEVNEKGNHSCNICKQEFPYKSSCRSHIISKHDPAKPFKCEECHYTMTSELRLIRHKALTHGVGVIKVDAVAEEKDDGDTEYTCQICSKTFNSLVRFKRHKNVHVAYNRPYKCDICQYRFTTRSQLTQHEKLHQEKSAEDPESGGNPENEFACDYCDEKLPGKRAVTMHVRRFHPQELQQESREKNDYKCIICEEAFSRESVLNTHMKMHELLAFEKEKEQRQELELLVKKELQAQLPTTKNETSSASLDLSNVVVKKKSDSDVAFVCVVCDQEFEERELLLKHQRKLHKELELNIVSDSKDVQSDPVNNEENNENNDEESMAVDFDPSEFTDGENAQKGRSSGPLPKCDLCQKTFAYNCLLQTHMKNSHSETKPFECKVCRMRFGYRGHLQKHELTHSAQNIQAGHHGSILYKCKVCSAKFLEMKALTTHLRTHRPVEVNQPKKVEIFQCSSCPQIFQDKEKLDYHVANAHRAAGALLPPSGSAHSRINPDPRRVAQRKPMSEKERFFGNLSIVKVERPAEEPVQMDL